MKSISKNFTGMLLMCNFVYSMQNNTQQQKEQQKIILTSSVYAYIQSGKPVPVQLVSAVSQVDAAAGIRASQHNQLLEQQKGNK